MNSRRKFLKHCAYLSTLGSAVSPLTMSKLRAAGSAQSEYRAIVQINLQGGNDMNMIVPTDDAQYARYAQIRGDLAIPRDRLIPITSTQNSGASESFGLHPAMAPLKSVYDDSDLAFVLNIGALKAPLNKDQFIARSQPIPSRLFAHNTQSEFIISGLPREGERLSGWGGRLADICNVPASASPIGMSVSTNSLWLRGEQSRQYIYGSGIGFGNFFRFDRPAFKVLHNRSLAIDELHTSTEYENQITQEIARTYKRSLSTSAGFVGLQSPDIDTTFPGRSTNGSMDAQLNSIVNLIANRGTLGQSQQLFFAQSPGWDFHDDALNRHDNRLRELAASLARFQSALQELGVADKVTTMTVSDFGRTLTGNGNNGTDHAWGNNQIVMGGAVDGGRVHGRYPILDPSDSHYLDSRGVLIPTLAIDQLSAAAAGWFGNLTDSQLGTLFPNLSAFSQKRLDIFS